MVVSDKNGCFGSKIAVIERKKKNSFGVNYPIESFCDANIAKCQHERFGRFQVRVSPIQMG